MPIAALIGAAGTIYGIVGKSKAGAGAGAPGNAPFVSNQGLVLYPGQVPPGYTSLTPQEKAYNELQIQLANKIAENQTNAAIVQSNASFTQSLDLRNFYTLGGIFLAILLFYAVLKKKRL